MWALMFGYASGVTNLNRWAKFLEAVVRRIGAILWTMYYDDGSLRDYKAAHGVGQLLVRHIFTSIGAPLADKKRQQLGITAVFLGLQHNTSKATSENIITFWPRPGLVAKIKDRMDEIYISGQCTSGDASKLMGILGFTSTGMWSRTGRIGIEPLRMRTRPDRRDWRIDEPLLEGMSFIKELLALEPKREAPVRPPSLPHVIAASDAQADSWPTWGVPHTGPKYFS